MEVQRLFRLSVWRPAKLIRKLDYILDNNEQSPSLTFESEQLLPELAFRRLLPILLPNAFIVCLLQNFYGNLQLLLEHQGW
jgi:hypothetical protein